MTKPFLELRTKFLELRTKFLQGGHRTGKTGNTGKTPGIWKWPGKPGKTQEFLYNTGKNKFVLSTLFLNGTGLFFWLSIWSNVWKSFGEIWQSVPAKKLLRPVQKSMPPNFFWSACHFLGSYDKWPNEKCSNGKMAEWPNWSLSLQSLS